MLNIKQHDHFQACQRKGHIIMFDIIIILIIVFLLSADGRHLNTQLSHGTARTCL